MRAHLTVTALLLTGSFSSHAATTVVLVSTDGREIAPEATASIVWHAMVDGPGHDPIVLTTRGEALDRLESENLTTFFEVDVSWHAQVVRIEGWGAVGALAPRIEVREHTVAGDELHPWAQWTTQGALALYEETRPDTAAAVVALSQVALQDAVALAVAPMSPPVWWDVDERLTIPIIVTADEEYRAFYGPGWKAETERRVARASALLGQAGLQLEVRDYRPWASPDTSPDLSGLLDAVVEEVGPHQGAVTVAFTQQPDLATAWADGAGVEDVGRAYVPGLHVIVADQAVVPGQPIQWDEAEEGVAIAHEVLHALGLPHLETRGLLMSGSKNTTVHALSPSTPALARAAATARYGGVEPLEAMTLLGTAAETWLDDPERQVSYITGNLAAGPGVPRPGDIAPSALSALTNVAIGRYYLELAELNPEDPALLDGALAHTLAAVEREPAPATTRLLTAVLEVKQQR